MSRVVWKYPLHVDTTRLDLPESAVVVGVGLDAERRACAWIELDPNEPNADPREFVLVGTGHEVPSPAKHIGHITLEHLGLVLHVYETGEG